jgi:hypothetical protein
MNKKGVNPFVKGKKGVNPFADPEEKAKAAKKSGDFRGMKGGKKK